MTSTTGHRDHTREHAGIGYSRTWAIVLAAAMLLAIVTGGSTQAESLAFFGFRMLCAVLLGVGLLQLLTARLSTMESLGLSFAAAGIGLVSLHLLPLPWDIFKNLPGREYVLTVFSVAGIEPQWMPLSLSPEATEACLLALLPPLAVFVATLTAGSRARWTMTAAVLIGATASVFLGLLQRLWGAESGLHLYEIPNFGSATGFFSNRNNFAMLLCVAIPLTWALALKLLRSRQLHPYFIYALGASVLIVLLMGIAASNSRSGVLLGMLALALSATLAFTSGGSSRRSSSGTRMSLIAILGGALVIGQFGMIGILRIVETDPMTEYRADISRVTLSTAANYFPIGSGFGTFRDVYAKHETPDTMMSAYVNHAHNDWMELWLEGGLPAALLMACFLALFLSQTLRIWRPKGPYASQILPKAASIGVLVLLLHSLAEYPLRMPALAAVFAMLMAFMLTPPNDGSSRSRSSRAPRPETGTDGNHAPAPHTGTAPAFRVGSATPQPSHSGPHRTRPLP